ncbi:AAA family ATPase [Candidatus Cyanaurora vandensis]|uniref:AAA family ATPase n=1 Tax=Candidatus Cyanaurora vandensis TaxID=2714958 RepID=UPI00257E1BE8|nr:AAA family ATPase [Candidatus Cyanaurora vandensis]
MRALSSVHRAIIKNDPLQLAPSFWAAYRAEENLSPLIPPERWAKIKTDNLNPMVAQALQGVLTGDRIQVIRAELGPGGVGMGYGPAVFSNLAGLQLILAAEGIPFTALTPSAVLARQLQQRTEVPSQTLTSYLLLPENRRGVLFVDWASFTELNQAEALFTHLEKTQSRLILVGLPQSESAATGLVLFLDQWFMMLFFLLSGAGTWYALGSRTAGQYVTERLQRLLVPLVVGCLVVVPPLVYAGPDVEPCRSVL